MPMSIPNATELMREAAAFNTKVAAGMQRLGTIKDEDVEIATTPKDEILRTDKVTLYRYRPLTESQIRTPVLIAYSLIGRHTMTDLQEDRSLVRNLLNKGVDLWVVDWGNPSRADRWLSIDDYVSGYIHDCVTAMLDATGAEKVNLLGICEGGVFTLAYAALEPARVQQPFASDHPAGLPRRPKRRGAGKGIHQCVDPKPQQRRRRSHDRGVGCTAR